MKITSQTLVNHTNFYTVSTISSPGWFIPTVQGYALFEQVKPDVIILSAPIDNPKYVPYDVIYTYMADNNFQRMRCYTATGLIQAQVWNSTGDPRLGGKLRLPELRRRELA